MIMASYIQDFVTQGCVANVYINTWCLRNRIPSSRHFVQGLSWSWNATSQNHRGCTGQTRGRRHDLMLSFLWRNSNSRWASAVPHFCTMNSCYNTHMICSMFSKDSRFSTRQSTSMQTLTSCYDTEMCIRVHLCTCNAISSKSWNEQFLLMQQMSTSL